MQPEQRAELPSLLPVIAALGLSQIIGYGTLYYSFAQIAPSVAGELGASPDMLFGFLSAGFLVSGFVSPYTGRAMDEWGSARIMTVGSLVTALLFAVAAYSPSLWFFGIATIVMQLVSVTVLYDSAFATISQLAGRKTQATITHLTLVAGFSSTVFWPLVGMLIESWSWRGTYLAFAAMHLFLVVPLHAYLWRLSSPWQRPVRPTVQQQSLEDPPLHGARSFWMIALSFAMSTALITAIGTHLMPLLLAKDLGPMAYTLAMFVGPAQVAIRIANATVMRRLTAIQGALFSALALPIAAALLLITNAAWVPALMFAIVFGVGQGLFSITRGTVPLHLFGPQGYGKRLGQLAAVRTLLSAGAPFVFALGWNYFGLNISLAVCVVLGIAAAVPLMLVRPSTE